MITQNRDTTAKSTPASRRSGQSCSSIPKRAPTAFNFFFKEERQRLMEEATAKQLKEEIAKGSSKNGNPSRRGGVRRPKKAVRLGIPFDELARMVSNKWKEMASEERLKYEDMARKDKIRNASARSILKSQNKGKSMNGQGRKNSNSCASSDMESYDLYPQHSAGASATAHDPPYASSLLHPPVSMRCIPASARWMPNQHTAAPTTRVYAQHELAAQHSPLGLSTCVDGGSGFSTTLLVHPANAAQIVSGEALREDPRIIISSGGIATVASPVPVEDHHFRTARSDNHECHSDHSWSASSDTIARQQPCCFAGTPIHVVSPPSCAKPTISESSLALQIPVCSMPAQAIIAFPQGKVVNGFSSDASSSMDTTELARRVSLPEQSEVSLQDDPCHDNEEREPIRLCSTRTSPSTPPLHPVIDVPSFDDNHFDDDVFEDDFLDLFEQEITNTDESPSTTPQFFSPSQRQNIPMPSREEDFGSCHYQWVGDMGKDEDGAVDTDCYFYVAENIQRGCSREASLEEETSNLAPAHFD